jgi:hypothetical protein
MGASAAWAAGRPPAGANGNSPENAAAPEQDGQQPQSPAEKGERQEKDGSR